MEFDTIVELAPIEKSFDLARMPHVQDQHDAEHQCRVKDVQDPFMTQEISPVPLCVLDYSNDVPDSNEGACRVKDEEILTPVYTRLGRSCVWSLVHREIEGDGDRYEEEEEEELENKTAEDDVCSECHVLLALRQNASPFKNCQRRALQEANKGKGLYLRR